MSPEIKLLVYLSTVIISCGGVLYIITNILSLYKEGVRKLFTLNKKRREMFSNIIEHIHKNPADWKINQSEYNTTGFNNVNITDDHDIKIVFDFNIIANSKYKKDRYEQKSDAYYLSMTLEERIKTKRAYKFLVKYNKNKADNDSIDKFYISSTGFDKL